MPPTDDRSIVRQVSRGRDFDLYEEEDEFVLSVEMPGFDREDITASWDEGLLYVAAENDGTDRRERSVERTFRLPKEIEPDEIKARYRNGILEVRLPITSRRVRGTEIEVQGG